MQRVFVLLDEDVQLQQHSWLSCDFAGWWYVDFAGWWYVDPIEATVDGPTIVIEDLYVDFLVPPSGPGFRVLDLDEFGEAVRDGKLSGARAARALASAQAFLDRHLQRPGSSDRSFPDFPPAALSAVTSADSAAEADTAGR